MNSNKLTKTGSDITKIGNQITGCVFSAAFVFFIFACAAILITSR